MTPEVVSGRPVGLKDKDVPQTGPVQAGSHGRTLNAETDARVTNVYQRQKIVIDQILPFPYYGKLNLFDVIVRRRRKAGNLNLDELTLK